MDILYIRGIRLETVIGVYDWERVHPQTLNLSLTLAPDYAVSGSDELADVIDYAELVQKLRTYAATLSYRLLEALAEDLAAFLLREYPLHQVTLDLCKPGVLPDAQAVGIEITRKKEN